MGERTGILAGGNWIVDHVKLIDAWPAQDALVSIRSQSSSNGGSPYNILVDLAQMGAAFPLAAVGLVGEDANGRAILNDCRARGIDVSQLRTTAAAPTSYTDVMTVEATGRRTFFHQRGANAHLDGEHFDFSATNARFFHLGYLLLLDRLDQLEGGTTRACDVLRRARAAGLRTSVDCVSEDSGRFGALVLPALPQVDVLFVNDFEAERLTGIALRQAGVLQPSAVRAATERLLAAGVQAWVVLHVPEGVYARGPGSDGLWQPALRLPTERIAGAVGAGDALAAGVLYGLHEDWPMIDALRLGVAVAAASLTDATCSRGVRPVRECLALVETFGFQRTPGFNDTSP
ncbi:MAG TPA: carbohydrate kinase family protein [Opitutaceae bacterium]